MSLETLPLPADAGARSATPDQLEDWVAEMAPRVSHLLDSVTKAAPKLKPYIDPRSGAVDLAHLMSDDEKARKGAGAAWNETRTAHYELEAILKLWRGAWRKTTKGARRLPRYLVPIGGDVYLWKREDLVSSDALRHFGHRIDRGTVIDFRPFPVDICAIAIEDKAGAGFHLTGPAEITARGYGDGIVQPGNPSDRGYLPELTPYELGTPTAKPADLEKAKRRSRGGGTW